MAFDTRKHATQKIPTYPPEGTKQPRTHPRPAPRALSHQAPTKPRPRKLGRRSMSGTRDSTSTRLTSNGGTLLQVLEGRHVTHAWARRAISSPSTHQALTRQRTSPVEAEAEAEATPVPMSLLHFE